MKTIDDMEESFNSLQTISDGQFRQISDLKKQLKLLKEENESLKVALPSTTVDFAFGDISNAQLICETQLLILKDRAITRELTFEEAKKMQIFVDVLDNIKKNAPDKSKIRVENLSAEELLGLMDAGVTNDSIN